MKFCRLNTRATSENLIPELPVHERGRQVAPPVPRDQTTSAMSEVRLLHGLRTGDPEAFRQIVSSYQSPLLRRARTMISDFSLGEDAVQETWLAVLRGIHNFESRSSLKTWIFSILDNRAKTLVKRERRTLSLTPEMMSAIEGSGERDGPSRLSTAFGTPCPLFAQIRDNQEAAVISQEAFRHIQVAIASLPIRQRKVFQLRVLLNHSANNVSLTLGISGGNQRVLLYRARLALKTALQIAKQPGLPPGTGS